MKTRLLLTVLLSSVTLILFLGAVGSATGAQGPLQLDTARQFHNGVNAASESSQTAITFTSVATLFLPLVSNAYPWPVSHWLSQQQDNVTGLVASQQDQFASTYNNALAILAFTLKGDYDKARRILDFYDSRASEFFHDNACNDFSPACIQTHACGSGAPCGFFQSRSSTTGVPFPDVNRWIGDNAWLLMALHYYEAKTGDTHYGPMTDALVYLLKSLQQADGHIASGWEDGDTTCNLTGNPEGNLDAYKALSLFGESQAAQQVKDWLDHHDMGSMVWEAGPLDLHSWRVLALGKEYGHVLPDIERTDDPAIRYKSTIVSRTIAVTGFLPYPGYCNRENIWVEGTGQMAVAFYKAGYQERGDFYVGELGKLLVEPPGFPGTQALPYYALPSLCDTWVDTTKGHVAAVVWYVFARERFDPLDGVIVDSFHRVNPVVKLEAENYSSISGNGLRLDGAGVLSEGRGIHVGGDDNIVGNNPASVEYKFNVLVTLTPVTVTVRYADDVAGDIGKIMLDGVQVASFNTVDTGSWPDYITIDLPVSSVPLTPSLHTLRLDITDNGTYGLTVDYLQLAISSAVSVH